MPKKILLIENESAFAAGISEALESSGFDVRVTGEGKEGLDLAREWAPAAVVLCVELPGMSGYLVCQKLKKDDALKAIPLVLTSAEATQETFEKHRTLKARADEYLLKPFVPAALLEKLAVLVGLPDPAGAAEIAAEHDEELVSLEEEMGLEALPSEPDEDLPALDLQSLPDEPALAGVSALTGDDDLSLLDEAFEGLAGDVGLARTPADAGEALDLELAREVPVAVEAVDAEAATLPDEPRADFGFGVGLDDADTALGALGGYESLPVQAEVDVDAPRAAPIRGASADLLRAAGITLLDDAAFSGPAVAIVPPPPAILAPPPFAPGADAVQAAASAAAVARLERELSEARDALAGRDDELAAVRARADELSMSLGEAEADRKQARDAEGAAAERAEAAERRAEQAERRLDEAEAKAADDQRRVGAETARAEAARDEARRKADEAARAAVAAASRAEALERELDELRTDLVVARGEAEGARGQVENATAELRKRVAELEATNAKHEERVLKAYQKIKNDEKVKDKVRKALAIAGQLLEDGLPPESPGEKERRVAAATLLGRDS
jgi:CheY-like chemotaxis protein